MGHLTWTRGGPRRPGHPSRQDLAGSGCPSGRPSGFHVTDGHVGRVVPMYSIPPSPPARAVSGPHAPGGIRALDSVIPRPSPSTRLNPHCEHLPTPASRPTNAPLATRTPQSNPPAAPSHSPARLTPQVGPPHNPGTSNVRDPSITPGLPRGGRTRSRSEREDPPPPRAGWRGRSCPPTLPSSSQLQSSVGGKGRWRGWAGRGGGHCGGAPAAAFGRYERQKVQARGGRPLCGGRAEGTGHLVPEGGPVPRANRSGR